MDDDEEDAIDDAIDDIDDVCGHLGETLRGYFDGDRIVIGDDESVWGAYWPGSNEIEITESTLNDAEELVKTLRHEAVTPKDSTTRTMQSTPRIIVRLHRKVGDGSQPVVLTSEG